jgi:hypothetical protein
MKEIGVKLVDFSKNMCYEDICEVLTPSGYPIMKDNTHFTYHWSRYWASEADILTEFP